LFLLAFTLTSVNATRHPLQPPGILCLDSSKTLALYKPCTYLLTYLITCPKTITRSKREKYNSETHGSWRSLQSRYFMFSDTSYILSPPVINVSMIIWAPLKKSPNCASQIGRTRGFSMLTPYSKPSTASSDSGLLATYHYTVVNG